MTLPSWRNSGIAPRVILIVVVPVVLMFVSALLYSVHSRSKEVSEELNEHGNLIASLLAEVSEYGVVSGNLDYLRTTISTVLAGENSVSQVRILGSDGHGILDLHRESVTDPNARMFIAPIRRQVVAGNELSNPNAPLLSSNARSSPSVTAQQTIGHVEVTVTSARILAKQRHRILVGLFIAAISLVLSVFLGSLMALRITRPLRETIAAVRRIRGGNYAPALEVTATGEATRRSHQNGSQHRRTHARP
jgi:two-component system, NarL family, sensor histidine kinase UhpB